MWPLCHSGRKYGVWARGSPGRQQKHQRPDRALPFRFGVVVMVLRRGRNAPFGPGTVGIVLAETVSVPGAGGHAHSAGEGIRSTPPFRGMPPDQAGIKPPACQGSCRVLTPGRIEGLWNSWAQRSPAQRRGGEVAAAGRLRPCPGVAFYPVRPVVRCRILTRKCAAASARPLRNRGEGAACPHFVAPPEHVTRGRCSIPGAPECSILPGWPSSGCSGRMSGS